MGITLLSIGGHDMATYTSDFDATAATGGNSQDVGFNGGDWMYFANTVGWGDLTAASPDSDSIGRKRSGGEQIQVEMYSSGADPLPTIAGQSAFAPFITAEALDGLNGDGALSDNASIVFSITTSRINSGLRYTWPLTTETKTFWWLGTTRNGLFTATLSISDASIADQTYALPTGASGTNHNAWVEGITRGTWDQVNDGVTISLQINRDTVNTATGQLGPKVAVLLPAVRTPEPRGMFVGRRR